MNDDTISRAAALDALGERPVVWSDNDDYTLGERNQYDMDRLAIETVPSAQPANIAKLQPNCNQVASDCISRAAAIEEIEAIVDTMSVCVSMEECKGMRSMKQRVLERLKALPSAQPGWIPVTEKPIEGGQYIVTLKDDKEVWTDIAEWNPTFGGRWQAEFFDCGYRDIDNVVAWMPLPKPWKGGQNG